MSQTKSKYVEREPSLGRRARAARQGTEFGEDQAWLNCVQAELPRFLPFLTRQCGLDFRGRILEIGAGGAWLSAELSKLPRVVEVITTDLSSELLKERAPRTFDLLDAKGAKIVRMPADFHHLDFPENHFDFVVGSAVLREAENIVQVLREAKRVLKPGGQFVAIREPVWPWVSFQSRSKLREKLLSTGANEPFYTLADYKEFFRQAALPLRVRRVNLARGLKYYLNEVVNGLTHARYAFIGSKRRTPKPTRRPTPMAPTRRGPL